MTRFERLIDAIRRYDNESKGIKVTAHHSAVSVRVEEMKKLLGDNKQDQSEEGHVLIPTDL